jgi:hypothetical protein
VPVIQSDRELGIPQSVDDRPIHFDSIILGQWILFFPPTVKWIGHKPD